MNKTVRIFRLNDVWNIGENESWYSDMAANGLHLKKSGLFFVHFIKGEPLNMRYRLELTNTGAAISSEQIQMYSDNGWEYVTSYGSKFNVFCSPNESGAPELHTDPAEQSFTLQVLSKLLTTNAAIGALCAAFICAISIFLLSFDSTPILSFIEGSTTAQYFAVIVNIFAAYKILKSALTISKLRKSLSEGKPIDHHTNWRGPRRAYGITYAVFMYFALLSIILPLLQFTLSKTADLPKASTTLPIVLLSEVESYSYHDIDLSNSYRSNWSFFAPVQLDSKERGIVPTEKWKDGSGIYSPSITSRVYRLRFTGMEDSLIKDLVSKYSILENGEEFSQKETSDFDLLLVHEGKFTKEILAYKDKNVVYLRYNGYADIDILIEKVSEKLILLDNYS